MRKSRFIEYIRKYLQKKYSTLFLFFQIFYEFCQIMDFLPIMKRTENAALMHLRWCGISRVYCMALPAQVKNNSK